MKSSSFFSRFLMGLSLLFLSPLSTAATPATQPEISAYVFARSLPSATLIAKQLQQYPYIKNLYTHMIAYNEGNLKKARLVPLNLLPTQVQYQFHGLIYVRPGTTFTQQDLDTIVKTTQSQLTQKAWTSFALLTSPLGCQSQPEIRLIKTLAKTIEPTKVFSVYVESAFLDNNFCEPLLQKEGLGDQNIQLLKQTLGDRGQLIIPTFNLKKIAPVQLVLKELQRNNIAYQFILTVTKNAATQSELCQLQSIYQKKGFPPQFKGIIVIGWMDNMITPDAKNMALVHDFVEGKPMTCQNA